MTLQDLIACAVVNGTEREVFEPLLSRGLERDLDALRNRQLISVYASHVDPYFRAMAASHTATPWSILRELMNDRDQAVRGLAQGRASRNATKAAGNRHGHPDAQLGGQRKPHRETTGQARSDRNGLFATSSPIRQSPSSLSQAQRLTGEQKRIVRHAPKRHLTVQAFAGTGKTSTLVEYAKNWSDKGLYLAFSRPIRDQAERSFAGTSVSVYTMHQLAYRAMGIGEIAANRVDRLQRHHLKAAVHEVHSLTATPKLLQVVSEALRRYLVSDDRWPAVKHLPNLDDLDIDEAHALAFVEPVIDYLMGFAGGDRPFTDDMYLKQFALREPVVAAPADYVMVDEAQDLNPMMIGVIRRFDVPLVVVGDHYQSIYAFRGATSAMDAFDGHEASLTLSWRFGPEIAHIANRILEQSTRPPALRVRGTDDLDSVVLPGESRSGLVLARTNASLFDYLIRVRTRFFIKGGFGKLKNEVLDAISLFKGRRPSPGSPLPYRAWSDLEAAKEDGDPRALRLVKLIATYGPDFLERQLEDLERYAVKSRDQADVVLSTAHSAKGLQHDVVTLLDDFASTSDLLHRKKTIEQNGSLARATETAYNEEVHLLYVAATRARSELYIPTQLHSSLV